MSGSLRAQGATVPVPVGGWNAYDSLDAMPPNDAVRLDNMFPETSYVRLRRGSSLFCATGSASPVQTLFEYNGGGTSKLLAAAGGHIYNVTTGSASSLASGYSADVWSYTNFSTGAGTYVIAANGTDAPWAYNGSTVSALSVSGVSANSLTCPCAYLQRMFYVQAGTLSVWYATAGGFQGTLTEFNVGALCVRGGQIASIGTWTRDNGFGGADELFVIVTTKGEVLIYQGVDPGSALLWGLSGRFLLGEPVSGSRCIMRDGPDMILLCEDGFQPLSSYLQLGQTKANATALSRKIGNAVAAAVKTGKSYAGWQAMLYPQGTQILVNVPVDNNGTFYQYVVNTVTGSWCRYLGWNAYCWGLLNAKPYFGAANGEVYLADSGTSDSGSDIVGEMITAYQYVGGRGLLKRFTMARPVLQVTGTLSYAFDVAVDYNPTNTLASVSSNVNAAGLWGSATWGAFAWGASSASQLQRRWVSVSGLGYAVACHLKVSTGSIGVNVNSIDLLYERGLFV